MNQWINEVHGHLSHLSKPQALILALWSFVMVVIGSSGVSRGAAMLAKLTRETNETNLRQRMREWCWDKADKAGKKRTEVVVSDCFVPLLLWILDWWDAEVHRLALALDATTLGQRYVVLALSVLYRGCAIPIAWKVFAYDHQSEWKPEWKALLAHFKGVLPDDWLVIVLADRGLYANWLFAAIRELGWHPFLRINSNGKYCAEGSSQFMPLTQLADRVGCQWVGRVTCFKSRPVVGTLLVSWGEGYADPWLILTDLQPEQAQIAWYGLRAWIECSFKDIKRGGWQWQATHMTDPHRAERHWLVIAVATLWAVSMGGEADPGLPASSLDPLPPDLPPARKRSKPRLFSCFRQGCLTILAYLLSDRPVPRGSFHPGHDSFY